MIMTMAMMRLLEDGDDEAVDDEHDDGIAVAINQQFVSTSKHTHTPT